MCKEKQDIWICGLWSGDTWYINGVFTTEEMAVKACKTGLHFVGPATLNEEFPNTHYNHLEIMDWPGLYYPKCVQNDECDESIEEIEAEFDKYCIHRNN